MIRTTRPCLRLFLLPALLAVLVLAGCAASPAPEFRGGQHHLVQRDGRDYSLWHKGERVEVIRHGPAHAGQHRQIRETMILLIPEVTGCRLKPATLQGDSGEMRASLTCKGDGPAPAGRRRSRRPRSRGGGYAPGRQRRRISFVPA